MTWNARKNDRAAGTAANMAKTDGEEASLVGLGSQYVIHPWGLPCLIELRIPVMFWNAAKAFLPARK